MGITVVNLNPCLDWSWHINAFTYGGMNRVQHTRQDAAGKGINVAIALNNLGLSPICKGFNYLENGKQITTKLDALGVNYDFVWVEGAVRINIKLYDETGTMTEINQSGNAVNTTDINALVEKINQTNAPNDLLILSGSRPAGVDVYFYAQLCKTWQGRVILDTEGEALLNAIETAPPYCIKPNLFELESTFGVTLSTHKDIIEFARTLIAKGIQIICCSLGAEGALIITQKEAFFAPALPLDVKAVQGAGDAMVAGLVYAMEKETDPTPDKLLRCAVAAASASVVREGTQMCDGVGFGEMLERVIPSPRMV